MNANRQQIRNGRRVKFLNGGQSQVSVQDLKEYRSCLQSKKSDITLSLSVAAELINPFLSRDTTLMEGSHPSSRSRGSGGPLRLRLPGSEISSGGLVPMWHAGSAMHRSQEQAQQTRLCLDSGSMPELQSRKLELMEVGKRMLLTRSAHPSWPQFLPALHDSGLKETNSAPNTFQSYGTDAGSKQHE